MLTADQVSEALREHVEKAEDEGWGSGWDFWDCLYDMAERTQEVPGLGTVTLIENYGGEGLGDAAHLVFSVTSGAGAQADSASLDRAKVEPAEGEAQLFKMDGYYSSYNGTEWDGELYEVVAVERPVTFYEKKPAVA